MLKFRLAESYSWMGVSMPTLLCLMYSADEAAGVRTNWYSALQDLLLYVTAKVFWGQMIDSSTIGVATGRVEIDMCMTRWRDFYHHTVCHWVGGGPTHRPDRWSD
jgi:hypothetical protein